LRTLFLAIIGGKIPQAVTVGGRKKYTKLAHRFLTGRSTTGKEIDLIARRVDWRGLLLFLDPPFGGGPFVAANIDGTFYVADASRRTLEDGRSYLLVHPKKAVCRCIYRDGEIAVFECGEEKLKFRRTQLIVVGEVIGQITISSS